MSNVQNYGTAPRLARQQSIERIQEKKNEIGLSFIWCGFPAAIAALVIAGSTDWDSSPCNIDITYILDPVDFLTITGAIQVTFAVCYMLVFCNTLCCYGPCCFCMKIPRCQKDEFSKFFFSSTLVISIFFIVWAILGLLMFFIQFNDECKSEPIALMILSWSIIYIALMILTFFSMGLFICCNMCIAWIRPNNDNNRDNIQERDIRRERESLLSSV